MWSTGARCDGLSLCMAELLMENRDSPINICECSAIDGAQKKAPSVCGLRVLVVMVLVEEDEEEPTKLKIRPLVQSF